MVRSRWAALALAGCALLLSGCGSWSENGLFSHFRTASTTHDCECADSDTHAPDFEAPTPLLTPPEGAGAAPPLAPPRIVPIPHAAPMPYTPTTRTR
jgi:hypothetical protein